MCGAHMEPKPWFLTKFSNQGSLEKEVADSRTEPGNTQVEPRGIWSAKRLVSAKNKTEQKPTTGGASAMYMPWGKENRTTAMSQFHPG